MVGDELGVEQRETAGAQPGDQRDQRELRRVAVPAEHALAEEGAAEADAVKPADKLAVLLDLHRVGVAEPVQLAIEPGDPAVDPGLRRARRRRLSRREVAVDNDLEGRRPGSPARSRRETCNPSSGRTPRVGLEPEQPSGRRSPPSGKRHRHRLQEQRGGQPGWRVAAAIVPAQDAVADPGVTPPLPSSRPNSGERRARCCHAPAPAPADVQNVSSPLLVSQRSSQWIL